MTSHLLFVYASYFEGVSRVGSESRRSYPPIRVVYVNIFTFVSTRPHNQTEHFNGKRRLRKINNSKYVWSYFHEINTHSDLLDI